MAFIVNPCRWNYSMGGGGGGGGGSLWNYHVLCTSKFKWSYSVDHITNFSDFNFPFLLFLLLPVEETAI
jgi:hypothetical protein